MLKINLAFVVLLAMHSAASAGEVTERCGEKVNWQSLMCLTDVVGARDHERDAAVYEVRAKHAESDGDIIKAMKYRNLAAFEKAEADRLRAKHPSKK